MLPNIYFIKTDEWFVKWDQRLGEWKSTPNILEATPIAFENLKNTQALCRIFGLENLSVICYAPVQDKR